MKKITEVSIRREAKNTMIAHLVLLVLLGFASYWSKFSLDSLVFSGLVLLVAWLTEGRVALRTLLNPKYLRSRWIQKTDERNIYIDNIVYRKMFQVISILYYILIGLSIGFLSQYLSSYYLGMVVLGFVGVSILLTVLFYSFKWYYQRNL